jgi:o-succinylbenzoate synthase
LGLDVLLNELLEFPSIQFGLEQAFLSLQSSSKFELFPSNFTRGKQAISINGLVWMGDEAFMKTQIKEKIEAGFSCIKMKIGAIDFETELDLLTSIRKEFSSKDIELRVDANGGFHPQEALEKLKRLSALEIHSIEQPIRQGQFEEMARLCEKTPVPIALDEELIGVFSVTEKKELLQTIQPQYIILKPSFIGGFQGSDEWISLAEKQDVRWWVTSALESNVGLNAIAQWTFTLQNPLPQGLGTGGLYTNNFESPLEVKNGKLHHAISEKWNFNLE